jgi:uncharacterized protein DUF2630
MKDERVLEQINKLASEEKALWKKEEKEGVSDEDRKRLDELNVTLDQCWDLLHQRRAARRAGLDPSNAKVRPAAEVEGYEG